MRESSAALRAEAAAPRRYLLLAALWGFLVVNYLDRVAISFAGPSIMKSLALGPDAFGVILSSFAIGYALSQLPGGLVADRWGARPLLIAAPILWAVFTAAMGAASTLSAFVVIRILFGAAEGLGNATCFKVIADNFPVRERGRAAAIMMTSFATGPALAGPLMGSLLSAFGWRTGFVLLAIPALAFAVINAVIVPAKSGRSPRVDASAVAEPEPGLSSVIRSPTLWTLAIGYMAFNMGYWGFLGWMPTYLSSAHHINLKSLGMLGGIPYLFGIAGLLIFGWLGSGPAFRVKHALFAGSVALSAVALFLAFQASTLAIALAGLSSAALFLYGGLGVLTALVLESAPARLRATYVAVVTTAGHIGGVVAPAVLGFLVARSGNFASGFAFMIGGLVLSGLLVAHLGRRSEPEAIGA